MTPEQQDQHDRLVAMLHEQMEMGAAKAVVHQPTVIIGDQGRLHLGEGSRVDSFVKIEIGERAYVGRFVHVASFAHLGIGGGVLHIEDYAAVASGARLVTGSNQPDAVSMSACAPADCQRVERSFVRLGRFATVLAGATVLPGVTLGEGAVLAAGAVATRDIPPWQIWAGVPAKFLRTRDVQTAHMSFSRVLEVAGVTP
jgi:acetyltransferase-like isoleucine patch superfamily enzyme